MSIVFHRLIKYFFLFRFPTNRVSVNSQPPIPFAQSAKHDHTYTAVKMRNFSRNRYYRRGRRPHSATHDVTAHTSTPIHRQLLPNCVPSGVPSPLLNEQSLPARERSAASTPTIRRLRLPAQAAINQQLPSHFIVFRYPSLMQRRLPNVASPPSTPAALLPSSGLERLPVPAEEPPLPPLTPAAATRQPPQHLPATPSLPSALLYDPSRPPSVHNNGAMSKICAHCHARRYVGESSGFCCLNGRIKVLILQTPPPPLHDLLSAETEESRHFLSNIRQYNSAFQMTSIGCKEVRCYGWNPNFRVQGQISHSLGSLCPPHNQTAKFAQIFFLGDAQQETEIRANIFDGLRRSIIRSLQDMLDLSNSYVSSLKMAKDILESHSDEYKVVIHPDRKPSQEHSRRFNAPSCNEVAVLLLDEEHGKRDIVLRYRDATLQRISETHRSYDAQQYPLLFSRGENGYNFATTDDRKISAMRFYAHRLMSRVNGNFNAILRSQKLMQQFAVDMFVKVETERLHYLRREQTRLRAASYSDFRDAIHAGACITVLLLF